MPSLTKLYLFYFLFAVCAGAFTRGALDARIVTRLRVLTVELLSVAEPLCSSNAVTL